MDRHERVVLEERVWAWAVGRDRRHASPGVAWSDHDPEEEHEQAEKNGKRGGKPLLIAGSRPDRDERRQRRKEPAPEEDRSLKRSPERGDRVEQRC